MDSKTELYLHRARTELDAATILLKTSANKILNQFNIDQNKTFYSGVISHSYYSIFYCAKAMLLARNIETESPEVHKKTFEQFKRTFIDTGILDAELLLIYKKMIIRANTLLEIYKKEKGKRGKFTYSTIAQANKAPAQVSINNARIFFQHSSTFLDFQKP